MTVCDQFLRTAQTLPDAIMVHHLGIDFTFGYVASSAEYAASRLLDMGIKPGDRVGILLDNRVEYVIAYFAVQLAGGIVVALNPVTTVRELEQTLVNAQPTCVIVGGSALNVLRQVIPQLGHLRGLISIDETESAVGIETTKFSRWIEPTGGRAIAPNCAEHIAQIIYTSGTTGQPKGVALTHANLSANTSSIVQYLKLKQHDSMFTVLPFYYSYGNSLLLTHAAVGGKLVLAADFVFWNRALQLMQEQRASGFAGVPSTFALLFYRSKFASMIFPDLRYVTCAGGALSPTLAHRLRACLPNSDIYLMYGLTEATARLSALLPQDLGEKIGSIGKGIPGVTLRVLDESQKPVLPGEVGEIYAQGANIMHGYWQDAEATKLVLSRAGLRTGDLARVDEDGYIYIVGRCSDVIKCGAYRINPHEIEEVMLEIAGIEEAAVVGQPDELLGEIIVAYVVVDNQSVNEVEIRAHCKRRLPPHKWARRIEFVTELPKTSSGKICRSVLRH